MKVLLVEPWLGGSHLAWAQGLAAASQHEITIVGLPAELWRWRLQGSAPTLAASVRTEVARHGTPDLLLISGMTDVAQLLGLVRIVIGPDVAVAVYQHETQLLYPTVRADRSAVLVNWTSWLAADAVFFNSDTHRREVVEALPGFLDSLPDHHHLDLLDEVIAKFETLPLGVDLSWVGPGDRTDNPHPVILWPHRWEPDKAPEVFDRALARLSAAGLTHRVVLAGEAPTVDDGMRARVAARHGPNVVAMGPLSLPEYRDAARTADLVVSCARHEWFGIAVVEAVAAGSIPVVPDALAYPEVLGHRGYRAGTFGSALEAAVRAWKPQDRASASLVRQVQRFDWSVMGPRYDRRLGELSRRR
jgi:glycosyltransferase involved in cell wall biosynthesis